jgi:hypothetical protein
MTFTRIEIGWGGVDWIGLAQDRDKRIALVNVVMNFWVISMNADKCGAVIGIHSRGNQSTWRKPAPVLLCPAQIPYDLTSAATMEGQ